MKRVMIVASVLWASAAGADHASRDVATSSLGTPACGARLRDVHLSQAVSVDGFKVELRLPLEQRPAFEPTHAAATVTVAAGRFTRTLVARGVGHVLRFDPALRGEDFRVTFAHEPGAACVARVTLLSGDEPIAVVEP